MHLSAYLWIWKEYVYFIQFNVGIQISHVSNSSHLISHHSLNCLHSSKANILLLMGASCNGDLWRPVLSDVWRGYHVAGKKDRRPCVPNHLLRFPMRLYHIIHHHAYSIREVEPLCRNPQAQWNPLSCRTCHLIVSLYFQELLRPDDLKDETIDIKRWQSS
jgi:hypothetical protein